MVSKDDDKGHGQFVAINLQDPLLSGNLVGKYGSMTKFRDEANDKAKRVEVARGKVLDDDLQIAEYDENKKLQTSA